MKIVRYPEKSLWKSILERPHIDAARLGSTVSSILEDVKRDGDDAVKKYEEQFDHVCLQSLSVSKEEMDEAEQLVSDKLKDAIRLAYHNIKVFHESQLTSPSKIETQPGVTCWQKPVAIQRVGLYIPGGSAPLFSTVLMLATPAKIAGCERIVLCTPPGKDGKVHPAVLFAAKVAGVSDIFKAGGVQAIGAMAYGTESIPSVYKIFGPGNQYVMEAKQQVSLHGVAIDMPAGPSEVCVIADENADCAFIAADLLSQAEHGPDSQVVLITTSEKALTGVQQEVTAQLESLPRKSIASQALDNSKLVLVHDDDEAMNMANLYAPEHLIIQTDNYAELAERVVNAGSVFLGRYACESAGDYASGTNHTLPTNGYATSYSGVNLDSYFRKITFQHINSRGIANIGPAVAEMAAAESLDGHKNAMTLRMKSLSGN